MQFLAQLFVLQRVLLEDQLQNGECDQAHTFVVHVVVLLERLHDAGGLLEHVERVQTQNRLDGVQRFKHQRLVVQSH